VEQWWIIPRRLTFSWSFFLFQSCFLSSLMLRHTVTLFTRILRCSVGCRHVVYMLLFPAEYKEDVKKWDHPGKCRGNAINSRLSNCNTQFHGDRVCMLVSLCGTKEIEQWHIRWTCLSCRINFNNCLRYIKTYNIIQNCLYLFKNILFKAHAVLTNHNNNFYIL